MGKNRKNQTEDLSRQSDECRTENLGTEQGNKGRLDKDISRQSVNNPGQRSDNSRSSESSRSTESSRTGSADQEPVDENSEDIP